MLFTSSSLIDGLVIVSLAIFLLHKYFSRNYDYWKKRGIVYIKPVPFLGNLFDIITFKSAMGTWQRDIYESTEEPYTGIFVFDKPALVLRSPELIKRVLTKDFNHFLNRTILAPEHNQLIAQLLFFSKNENWKVMRPKMTPAFTSGKLKGMFPTIKDIASNEMYHYIKNNRDQLDSKQLATKFAIEIVGRTAFGVKPCCFEEDDCDFQRIGKSFFDYNLKNAINQNAYILMQSVASFLRLEFASRSTIDFLKNIISSNIKEREKSNIKGNDIIDMVIELKQNKEFCEKFKFEGDKVLAPPFQFFAAGTETTSQTIAFALYELCINHQVQTKLRNEILTVLDKNEDISYDDLRDMKYLEMCILETLRKYPVLPFLDRQCNMDWTIPGTDIVIDKKARIYIPLEGLHNDEKYFPEPQKFNPERFANKSEINQNGLYYLPFGDGPRVCIGERMAMMSVKVALIYILSRFEIEPTPATPIPLKLTKSFLVQPNDGLKMRYTEYRRRN